MAGLVLGYNSVFNNIYNNKRVLVTGHTGFKGSWLVSWLSRLGAHVSGVSLVEAPAFDHLACLECEVDQYRLDIRDFDQLTEAIRKIEPEVVFHLAAQTLVRESYRDPRRNWNTNVQGTVNVMEALRGVPSLQAVIVVTSDKCYQNQNWVWGYRESDPLGGHDPYSASKAATELVVESYRRSYFSERSDPGLATVRAGNVIGGGDWAPDRILPDIVRSVQSADKLEIRSPRATRPWQHVLEPLSGYLLVGQRLLKQGSAASSAWNFGPDADSIVSVSELLRIIKLHWPQVSWNVNEDTPYHEAALLSLDSSKARQELNWRPVWNLASTVEKTIEWYRQWLENKKIITGEQLKEFTTAARACGQEWAE